MAWQRIEWSCGHTEMRQLYGPEKERDEYAVWAAEKGLCPECYKEKKRAEEKEAGPQFVWRHIWPDGEQAVEFVCYSGSYEIKDRLKERGWRFDREIVGVGEDANRIDKPGRSGWTKNVYDLESAEAEKGWIEENGWPIEKGSQIAALLHAPQSSRTDLIPPRAGREEK